jgi:diadenosine tetraphosphate (Ap4A) HIT family hydrolase
MKNKDCPFCQNLKVHINRAKILIPNFDLSKFIISETKNLIVTLDLFPINKDPYFLIISKKHYTSFSQIKENIDWEMNKIVKNTSDLYKDKKSIVIFEHGEKCNEKKSQSVYHSHTHLILTNNNYIEHIAEELNKLKIPYKKINFNNFSTQSVLKKYVENKSYLLFRQDDQGILVLETVNLPIYSQFFRILINKIDNKAPFINWKNYTSDEKSIIKSRLNHTISKIPKSNLLYRKIKNILS